MKVVFINRKPISGPWGGGNKFVRILENKLKRKGYRVTYDLSPDVNFIFCFDPRPDAKGVWYQDFINHRHKFNSKIIQRVGDVGTHSKPELTHLVSQTVDISDFVIFPSEWAKNFIDYKRDNYKIIYNAPLEVFHTNKKKDIKNISSIKVVTHHWSTNPKKGHEFYEYLGKKIENKAIKDIEFTFIGRYCDKSSSAGIRKLSPMNEKELSVELPKHDVYLTASIEEAGANHVLEAMAAGLPIVYRKGGGSIEEYCKDYGICYEKKSEMVQSLKDATKLKIKSYEENINSVVDKYEKIMQRIK